MSFKVEGVDLNTKIYGWGTASTFGGFNTSVVSSKLTMGGVSMKAVPRNANFMPFSTVLLTDKFRDDDSAILNSLSWAQVNRFILSNTAKVTRTASSSSIRPIYYSGTNPNGLGSLFIGGTSSSHRVSAACPPVVMILVQARGGNGGMGVAVKDRNAAYPFGGGDLARSCGGGGSGGAATVLYWRFPTTGINLVGHYKLYNGDVTLYDENGTVLLVCNKGNNGQDGDVGLNGSSATTWITSVRHPNGGEAVSGTYTGLSANSDFTAAYRTSQDGATSFLAAFGLAGGQGSLYSNLPISGGNDRPATDGGSFTSTIYLNGLSSQIFSTRSGGSALADGGRYQEGGGGGASRFGTGGNTRSGTGSGYGQGGGGGKAPYGEPTYLNYVKNTVSGGVGGSACIQFYW